MSTSEIPTPQSVRPPTIRPDAPPASTAPSPRTRSTLGPWIVLGFLGSVGMVVAGSAIGSVPEPKSDHWWYTVPTGTGITPHVAFSVSVALLIAGWIGVGVHARRGGLPVGTAWIVLLVWGLPLFLGPPLFSRDLYSYVAQGQLAHHGLDPYTVAPSALGPGNLLSSIASVWRDTASPYGPLFVSVSRFGVAVAGHSLVAQILVLRALELVGIGLMMVSLPALARRLGNDPGVAVWLAVLSPLALFSFVASGHNDALMIGLLLAGITVGTAGRLRWGVALCVLAATIKLPAAAGAVFLVADACTRVGRRKRAGLIAQSAAITVAVIGAVTVAAGYGWTWLGPTALHVPTELRVLITPLVSVGSFVYGVLHAVGVPLGKHATVTVVQTVGELVAVGVVLWLVVHVRDRDAVRLLGWALIVFVLLSPTVWPWYWMWGLAVLAASSAQRSRALATLAALGMLVVGAGGTPMLNAGDYWVTGPLLLAALLWMLFDGRWRTAVLGPVRDV